MRTYNAEETARLLPYRELAEAIAEVLVDPSVAAPTRTVVPLPNGGLLLVMPATNETLAVTKLVTVHPANAGRGVATVQSDILVLDARTGERLGLLDGAVLTARRTAALSLLAAQKLAGDPHGPLLIVGAGVQARAHLEALYQGLRTASVVLSSRTPDNVQALAGYARSLGMTVKIAENSNEAAQDAALVVTATTAAEPVLTTPLEPRQFVSAVGAFTPKMAELSPEIVASSRVVVDTLEGARAEAGELIQAASGGIWSWERVTELKAHLAKPTRDEMRSTVFKSVGHAMFDLAACKLFVKRTSS